MLYFFENIKKSRNISYDLVKMTRTGFEPVLPP